MHKSWTELVLIPSHKGSSSFAFSQKPLLHIDLHYLYVATQLVIKAFHLSDADAINDDLTHQLPEKHFVKCFPKVRINDVKPVPFCYQPSHWISLQKKKKTTLKHLARYMFIWCLLNISFSSECLEHFFFDKWPGSLYLGGVLLLSVQRQLQ